MNSFGLRYVRNGTECVLLQIGGDGMIFVLQDAGVIGQVERWIKPPVGLEWEVYPSVFGQTYPTRSAAQEVAKNLAERWAKAGAAA